jgi:pimeloyl-ACP methyl ester carboxylesterase
VTYAVAQKALFEHYGLPFESRRAGRFHLVETGAGEPIVFVHGSGMIGATWAPVLAQLRHRRCLAVDLPGFGLSDPHAYVRPLREEAVAQMTEILDALELPSAHLVGTSLGGMWCLNLALAAPERVKSVVSVGMPAVALPGVKADPYFRLMTVPGVRALISRVPPPRNVAKGMKGVLGAPAIERTPREWFDVVAEGMRTPGYAVAMRTHLNLALKSGREKPGNAFGEDDLRRLGAPVLFLWGEADRYGGPEIGERAAAVMPDARMEAMPGNHAPFLDDPEHVAAVIDKHTT